MFCFSVSHEKKSWDKIEPLLGKDDNLISVNYGIASIINQIFSGVFTNDKRNVSNPLKVFRGSNEEMFSTITIQTQNVWKWITSTQVTLQVL